jgi:hemerythrin-like domain-containing protein
VAEKKCLAFFLATLFIEYMSDTLLLLRLEHRNLSRLLGLIEDQVAAADAGAPLDKNLLGLAWEYFSDYPDLCHHPKEDLVYELLRKRDPGSCAGLKNLTSEHVRLRELTRVFGDAVRRLGEAPPSPEAAPSAEPAAREVIRDFTRRYRKHMREEDEHFFPLAEQKLSKDEWATLDFAVFDRDDPLLANAAEHRFAALRQRIEEATKLGRARGRVLDAGHRLRALSGLESFNELMKSGGTPFRLSGFAGGGYGLEHGHELVLFIPECSAERAAWCAYAYLCGRGWPWTTPIP